MSNFDSELLRQFSEVVKGNFREMTEVLQKFTSNEENINGIAEAASLMVDSIRDGGKIIACGNGGSMCDASHFCEELSGRFRNDRRPLPAIAISDASYISCVGNDYGFEHIFSRFIEACGKKEDLLLCISTSGNSVNVVNAAIAARQIGMKVVALTGRKNSGLAKYSDVELSTPASKYSDRAQEIHIKIIHTLVQLIEIGLGLDKTSERTDDKLM